jgi:hypothetical protein
MFIFCGQPKVATYSKPVPALLERISLHVLSHYIFFYTYKSLGPRKKIRNRKKKEQQKKERATETFFLAKLNTKPLKFMKMGAG